MKKAVLFKLYGCLLLSFIFTQLLKAQFFPAQPPDIWLKPAPAIIHPDSVLIGNYHAINLATADLKARLEPLYQSQSGTLFLVLKPSWAQNTDRLLALGDLSFKPEQATVGGLALDYVRPLTRAPVIIRLSYSRPQLQRRPAREIALAPGNYLAELIHFPDLLDKEQIRVVETYLALKYSINITVNDEPALRNYLDGVSHKLWNYKLDFHYNDQVLALGRLDSLDFYQSQTAGASEDDLIISAGESSALGSMPAVAIADKSLVILAKAAVDLRAAECGSAREVSLWKLRILHWQAEVDELTLQFPATGEVPAKAYLIGGGESHLLKVERRGNTQLMKIPLSAAMAGGDYLIYWQQDDLQCSPFCDVLLVNCKQQLPAKLIIKTRMEALPAQVHLSKLGSGELYSGLISEEFTVLQNIPDGEYQLQISKDEQLLFDQLLSVENCNTSSQSQGDYDRQSDQESETHPLEDLYQPGADLRLANIYAYPNPTRFFEAVNFKIHNLKDITFKMEVFDAKGRLIGERDITPNSANASCQYLFPHKGMYQVRFSSKIYSKNVAVLIN